MTSADGNVVPIRPVSLLALCEAAEASGLSDETVGRLIDKWYPEWLEPFPGWKPAPAMIRRAVAIPRSRPRSIKDVD